MNVKKIFMVGIKGTGMAALGELLSKQGYYITGSDVPQIYFTDKILKNAGIKVITEFNSNNITRDFDLIIHSSAYNINDNPELKRGKELGIKILLYTEALGELSKKSFSVGISGIHGKTTTTALVGTIIKELKLEASVLVGSGVASFNGSPIWVNGNDYFIAETCEYYRHFLSFFPRVILVTSIELDHTDYFKDINDIYNTFLEYIGNLPNNGELIYCADDYGAVELYKRSKIKYPNITYTPYGVKAEGNYKINNHKIEKGQNIFTLMGFKTDFKLQVPGFHTILDATGAIAVTSSLLTDLGDDPKSKSICIARGLWHFRGTKRRSEILGEAKNILFIDDYGHHPTAIETTLKGYSEFYPDRRIIVDFMSHTYTRTAKLLNEFARAFSSANIVILNKIYSSAREEYTGNITGETLFIETKKYHKEVYYAPEYDDGVTKAREILKPGDIFVTMGAGNNWQIGEILFKEFSL